LHDEYYAPEWQYAVGIDLAIVVFSVPGFLGLGMAWYLCNEEEIAAGRI